jgi:hypothetical protein
MSKGVLGVQDVGGVEMERVDVGEEAAVLRIVSEEFGGEAAAERAFVGWRCCVEGEGWIVRIVWACRSRGVPGIEDGILVIVVVGVYAMMVGSQEVCGSKGVLDIDGVLEFGYVIVVGSAGVLQRRIVGVWVTVVGCRAICGSKRVLDIDGDLENVFVIVVGSASVLPRRILDTVGGILVVESGVLVRG